RRCWTCSVSAFDGAAVRRHSRRVKPAGVGVVVTLLSSGCSLIFVEPPPPVAQQKYREFTCTTTPAAPVVDGIIATYQVFRTVSPLPATDADYTGRVLSRDADILVGVLLATTYGVSAATGGTAVSRCREALGMQPAREPRRHAPTPTPEERRRQAATAEVAE